MLKPTMLATLNKQIAHEFAAEHGYLSLSLYFADKNLNGFASFFRLQAQEEHAHALKVIDHVLDRGAKPTIPEVPAPTSAFETPLEAARYARKTEASNTQIVHDAYKVALDETDYPAQTMLQWFIDEQVEEEKWTAEMVELMESTEGSAVGLLHLDERFGRRVGAEPSTAAE